MQHFDSGSTSISVSYFEVARKKSSPYGKTELVSRRKLVERTVRLEGVSLFVHSFAFGSLFVDLFTLVSEKTLNFCTHAGIPFLESKAYHLNDIVWGMKWEVGTLLFSLALTPVNPRAQVNPESSLGG